jgi:hypothetical protein
MYIEQTVLISNNEYDAVYTEVLDVVFLLLLLFYFHLFVFYVLFTASYLKTLLNWTYDHDRTLLLTWLEA